MIDDDYLDDVSDLNRYEKRAWNSGFAGGIGKRAWNSGNILFGILRSLNAML